jgi:two-component system response regulator HydG
MSQKGSVLVVDDNISLGRTMSFVLKRKGYEVTTAKDGPEAIELVKERPFNIILMDIKMPILDGVETYRRIKKIRGDAIAIMMTAYVVEDLIQDALQEGAYGVINKPLDIDKITVLIEKAKKGGDGLLILVVDDDKGTCTTFKNILVKRGYDVAAASTGDEAIKVTKEKSYDIIFIDMKLPTINGLETYLSIKEVNPEAMVVIMTGFGDEMEGLIEQALNSSAYTCLHKPLAMGDVLKLIDEISEKRVDAK